MANPFPCFCKATCFFMERYQRHRMISVIFRRHPRETLPPRKIFYRDYSKDRKGLQQYCPAGAKSLFLFHPFIIFHPFIFPSMQPYRHEAELFNFGSLSAAHDRCRKFHICLYLPEETDCPPFGMQYAYPPQLHSLLSHQDKKPFRFLPKTIG